MSFKPTDEALIAYLYGEASQEETIEIARYLKAHPKKKERLQALSDTRILLSEWEDEALPEDMSVNMPVSGKSEWAYWRPFVGIAASLLLLLTFAWQSNFGLSYSKEGFFIGYQEINQGLSEEQVTELIRQEKQETIDQFMAYMREEKDSLNRQFDVIQASITEQPKLVYAAEKQALVDDMLNLSENLSANYREVMRELVITFSNNFEAQRIEDLQSIQAAFNELEDATIGNQLDIEDELIRLSDRLDAVIASLNNK